jgi:hypothetical protein
MVRTKLLTEASVAGRKLIQAALALPGPEADSAPPHGRTTDKYLNVSGTEVVASPFEGVNYEATKRDLGKPYQVTGGVVQ